MARDIGYQAALKLLKMAYKEEAEGLSDLSRRHAELALTLLRRVRVRLPSRWRRRVCRRCYTMLIPGVTCRVRIRAQGSRGSHVTMTCLRCGWRRRYYIKGGTREGKRP